MRRASAMVAPVTPTFTNFVKNPFPVMKYAEAMRGSGIFESFDDVRGLLELAEIEKLLYELRYELDNRPGWLRIPLQGLAALTARPPTG